MNNASFGMTVQKLVCDIYDLKANEWATKQYISNYDSRFDGVKSILPKIFNEIGAKPIKCLSFEKDIQNGGTINPHNFYLNNGMTLSIKTTKTKTNSKVAPNIVGQAGYEQLNYHFGHLYDKKIDNQFDIKKMIWNNISDAFPIFIDYLFLSDILLWIYIDGDSYNYRIIYREEKPDFSWNKLKFSFTRPSLKEWTESMTIKYENISIAEVQVHKKRNFKFRFILDKLEGLFTRRENNNETFGISVENAICNIFNLDKPDHLDKRSDYLIENNSKNVIIEAFESLPKPIEYVGDKKGDFGGQSKSPIDFILDGKKTLSLKTNIGNKVCPPEIGQPSIETFKKHFAYLITDLDSFNKDRFKELVFESIDELMNQYLKFLFDCDYLLWIYKNKEKYRYKILSSDLTFVFKKEYFTFTRDLNGWNESNTVKYFGKTIGEFQVHKKRNSLKFRFDMNNLIELLEEEEK
ncbi:MAG: hypothetical protein PHU05_00880 [Bacilli bacterium]|nr:hypothetical protein [Bacilli bacterium]